MLRDPRDVFVSWYPFLVDFIGMHGITMEEFAEIFFSGWSISSDCVKYYLDYWNRRHDPNIMIVKYEETKKDPINTIKRLAKFLEKDISDAKIAELIEFTSIENMRKNGAFNLDNLLKTFNPNAKTSGFIRKGKIGSWKEELSPELQKRFEEYMKPLAEAGLTF